MEKTKEFGILKWLVFTLKRVTCNYRAELTVLTVEHFAGLGVGIVPKYPTGFC
jgi:hypothetical protein